MSLKQDKMRFEEGTTSENSVILKFHGVEGFDVYNCSIPFSWDGKNYIFGRVERREEWANSWIRLFEESGKDEYTLVPDSMIYQLEDPYIAFIGDELVMGGTHVRKKMGKIDTYYGYFYRGTDVDKLTYYTSGPDYMKDIRLVQMNDGVGVFSRPRSEEIEKKYGSGSVVGFTKINSLDELSDEVIENAKVIDGLFDKDEWGGCNQCYYLDSGLIGIIAHKSYTDGELLVYMNTAFVFDPKTHKVLADKIIAVRNTYPKAEAKKPDLVDCTFTSGITKGENGKWNLYAGIGDAYEGRTVIDYPFEGFGEIVTKNSN